MPHLRKRVGDHPTYKISSIIGIRYTSILSIYPPQLDS